MISLQGFTAAELGITDPALTEGRPNLRFYDVKSEPFRIYGLYDVYNDTVFRRLPEEVAEATSRNVYNLHLNTAGGRVRFTTSSPYAAICCVNGGPSGSTGLSIMGSSSFDLYTKQAGRDTFCAGYRPKSRYGAGGYSELRTLYGDRNADGEYEVTINFPTYCNVDRLYIGLDCTSTLGRRADYTREKPVLYYGSSITQGGNASRAGMTYEALISRRLDTDFINLGFAGAALAEDAIVQYLTTIDCSVFVCDYDHNATDSAYLRLTHEKLYLAYRAARPDTPVIFVGRPDFHLNHEEDANRRDVIFTTYQNARRRGEKVLFVDGQSLFAGELREECTNDGTHPNDLGMVRMADVIGKAVETALTML